VTSEGRTLSGISGNAGTGTQSFTYDRLNRVMSGSLGGATHEYTYDGDGNRLTDKTGGVTTYYTYDRADQMKTRTVGSGSTINFAYDARGNLTGNAESGSTTTAYAYDWADRLVSIDPPGASNTAAFTFDALGRNATRTINGTLDSTYSYLGTTETVVRLATNGGTTTNAALDALGQRIAVKAGDASFFGWLLPDLHGNTAAALSQDETTVTDGLRYDAYGQLAAIYPSGGTGVSAKWRYQGRLLVSTSGSADLYDFSARSYAPGLGAFTQLDTVMGGAADPLSMNRYLYAEANPATMIDPTGHGATVVTDGGGGSAACRDDACPQLTTGQLYSYHGGELTAFTTTTTVDDTGDRPDPYAVVDLGPPQTTERLDDGTLPPPPPGARWVRLPDGSLILTIAAHLNAIEAFVWEIRPAVCADPLGGGSWECWSLPNQASPEMQELMMGAAAVSTTLRLARVGGIVQPLYPEEGTQLAYRRGYGPRGAAAEDRAAVPCSFPADTAVATPDGERPIGELSVGDAVLAYEEASGKTGAYPVSAVLVHDDPAIADLVIDGELVTTTPDHPFFTTEAGWTEAGNLWVGAHVRSAHGRSGIVSSVTISAEPQPMWDLTVAGAHTFFVGEGRWLVHNCARRTTQNVFGGYRTVSEALDEAHAWLGPAYREIAPGVFRSADGLRQFRMTTADLTASGPHVQFELVGPDGRWIMENRHVYLTDR